MNTMPRLLTLIAVVLVVAAGCEARDSLGLAPVTGTVTYGGKPLDHGNVVFFPETGVPGPQAVGAIQSNGTFRMQTIGRDGAAVGRHRVMVHCRRPLRPEEERQMIVPELLIPEKYSSKSNSPLRFEVKGGDNEYPIVLE